MHRSIHTPGLTEIIGPRSCQSISRCRWHSVVLRPRMSTTRHRTDDGKCSCFNRSKCNWIRSIIPLFLRRCERALRGDNAMACAHIPTTQRGVSSTALELNPTQLNIRKTLTCRLWISCHVVYQMDGPFCYVLSNIDLKRIFTKMLY